MSNLSFYERAIALRERYSNEKNRYKLRILASIVSYAFQHNDEIPQNFKLSVPNVFGASSAPLQEVLNEIGYGNTSIVRTHWDSVSNLAIFFIQKIS